MNNVHILSLSAYNSPTITESKNKDFVEYGEDNNYFQYLIDRFLYSNTNHAIITGVSNMIYGKGLDATDSNRKPNEYAQMVSIVKKDCLRKVSLERKLLGMAAMQIIYLNGKVKSVEHFPMHTLRAEKCNDKGEIEAWFYHHDWSNYRKGDKLLRIPAFGFGNGKEVELYIIKPYISGYHYYTPIDYSGALPYAMLEQEISDYLINDVMNGFSGTKVINFNNNIPPEEKRQEVANDVKRKLTGSRGDKVIVSFNASAENKTTVDDIPLNDAPAHYEYLSTECFEKLIVGHRVTSPMLLGIRDTGGGLGNNADEIETATRLFDNIVIRPYQLEIIEAIDEILSINGIALNLYFKTIQPLDFIDVNTMNAETNEEETGVKMSSDKVCCSADDSINEDLADKLIDLGESENEDWLLIDETEVDYDTEEELDLEIETINNKSKKKESLLSKAYNFVTTGTAKPRTKSKDDKEIDGVNFITRYVYSGNQTGERAFCNKMLTANKVYRKEDILAMKNETVNPGFGKNGASTYSIWFYKGGPRCGHKWLRRTYASFDTKIDPTNPTAKPLSNAVAEKYGYRIRNDKEVSMKPNDMPYKGYTKEYWDKMGFKN
jgi:hypothetical protein